MQVESPQSSGAAPACQWALVVPGADLVYTLSPARMKPSMTAEAHARHLVAPSVAAGLFIVLVLFALSRISSFLSTLAFALLSAAVAAGLACEAAVWQERGTRRIEISGGTLTLYQGRERKARTVEQESISRVKLTARLGRSTATLSLVSGGRIRLSGDAFPEEAFARIVAALAEWGDKATDVRKPCPR